MRNGIYIYWGPEPGRYRRTLCFLIAMSQNGIFATRFFSTVAV
jgi:hypothetical protein